MRTTLLALGIAFVCVGNLFADATIEHELPSLNMKAVVWLKAYKKGDSIELLSHGYIRDHTTGYKAASWSKVIAKFNSDGKESINIGGVGFDVHYAVSGSDIKLKLKITFREVSANLGEVRVPIQIDEKDSDETRPWSGGGEKYICYLEEQRGISGNKYQKWVLKDLGDGIVLIKNELTGRVLDYKDNGKMQWSCYIEENKESKYQKWRIEDVGNGISVIKNIHSRRVLDFHDGKSGEKFVAFLAEENKNNKFQKWTLEKTGETVLIRNVFTDRVLDFKDK